MRLALIFPAWCEEFGALSRIAKKIAAFPPLNLGIVGAMAEQAGWEVLLIDAEVEKCSVAEIMRRVRDFAPDLIGMTATTPFFHRVAALAEQLKAEFGTPIIVGGQHVSIVRSDAMLPCFDYLMIGECERVLVEFLQRFSKGERLINLPGVMMKHDGCITFTPPLPPIENLDDTTTPARHLFRNDLYFVGTLQGNKCFTSMQMSRGCPFRCVYCASELHGKQVRRHSLPRMIQELKHIVNVLGIHHIHFMDDTLTLDRVFILNLCYEIEKNGLQFTFEGSTRANLWDEELATRLKTCGLIRISFGLETAVPEILKLIKKDIPLDAYIAANRINNKLGVETINSVMLGLPGDTRETIKHTVDFLCRAKDVDHATYGIAMPYPGTELRTMAERGEHGLKLIEKDFSKLQRYGAAVMEVNGLSPSDLIKLQKEGLRRIYSCWWRWLPMIRRHGIMPLIPPMWDAIKSKLNL
ncbi:MAG: radical SAM protein [Verrucomicrobiia bacterium]